MASTTCCIAVLPPSPVVKPGLGITAVTRCIWFGGIPPHIGEAALFKEASLMGDVHFVLFPECPGRDEALVTFASFGYSFLPPWLHCWTEPTRGGSNSLGRSHAQITASPVTFPASAQHHPYVVEASLGVHPKPVFHPYPCVSYRIQSDWLCQ